MIDALSLSYFKNFREAELRLGGFTLLVGANASGKSNVREAFRFLHGISRGYTLPEILGPKYGEGGELVWKGIRGGGGELFFDESDRLDIHVPMGQPYYSMYVRHAGDGTPWIESESVTVPYGPDNEPVYTFHAGRSDPAPEVRRSLERAGKVHHLPSGERPLLPMVATRDSALLGSIVFPEIAAEFQSAFASMRFLDLDPEAMRRPSLPGQTVLGDRGENLATVLQAICESPDDKRDLVEWLRALTPMDVADFDFPTDPVGRVYLMLVERDGRRTSAYSASDGTLRFLGVIAALLGPRPAKFYFLEELENGLHPTRLSLLVELIQTQTRRRGIQVVATTHSPRLLGLLDAESREHASLVYRLPGTGEGRIRRILDIPGAREVLEREDWGALFESGWLEDAAAFADADETPAPAPTASDAPDAPHAPPLVRPPEPEAAAE